MSCASRMNLILDAGCALDEKTKIVKQKILNYHRERCSRESNGAIFVKYFLFTRFFLLFALARKVRVEKLIARFSNFLNGIPIDSTNVKAIIMTSNDPTQDDFTFLIFLTRFSFSLAESSNINMKKHVVIRCLRGGKQTVYVRL